MAQLVEMLVKKVGIANPTNVIRKTNELIRLLDLRASNISGMLNDHVKIVLCIDIAASLLDILFDQQNAVNVSGLQKYQYTQNKRMLEKLLDVNKGISVNDICIKLGIKEITIHAVGYLDLYKKVLGQESSEIDFNHPQYAAMSVYQACKRSNKKISKPKILAQSLLRPSQWTQLEQHFDKIINNSLLKDKQKLQTKTSNEKETWGVCTTKRTKISKIENYETWKSRMLAISKIQLPTNEDKENN